jgi:Spy/CpxP family protein refolding chaperone
LVVLILVVLPVVGSAKDVPGGKWWRNARVTKHLDLSDQEKQELDDKFVESRRKLIDLKANVERERFELDNLLENEELNEQVVIEQFKRLEEARSRLSLERFGFLMEVRKTLGFERFYQLKTLHAQRRHQKGRKGGAERLGR